MSPRAMTPHSDAARSPAAACRDAVAFSPLIPAALAGLLTWLVGRTIAPDADSMTHAELAALAAAGSTIVYALDRLRDLDRDRATSPRRAAFVDRHRQALGLVTLAASLLGGLCLLRTGPPIWLLCAAIGGLGLLHRRLKHFAAAKTLYVSLAWTGICVGLPWLGLGLDADGSVPFADALRLAAILLPCFAANLIASNLRDAETSWLRHRPRPLIAIAAGIATTGLAIGLLAPHPARAFAWVPAALLIALARYRPTELYGHLAVDGALLVGAVATALHGELA